MVKLKLKKNVKRILYLVLIGLVLLLGLIFSIKVIVGMIKSATSIDNKLIKIGYKKDDVSDLKNYFNDDELKDLLKEDKNEYLTKLIKEKYFLKSNLKNYTTYLKSNSKANYKDTVALVNTKANNEPYSVSKKTDINKANLMLVNKYNYLTEDYEPELVEMSDWYSYGKNYLTEEAYNHFIELFKAAKSDGYQIVASYTYRSYDKQKAFYDNLVKANGQEAAEKEIERPGFSEHQTGLAVDLLVPGISLKEFSESEEYEWLLDNAYKYGFILRYPENKTNITQSDFEPWHFRYVGTDASKIIHDEEITFDEYYAYYIEKEN